jgi:hypothetical protein
LDLGTEASAANFPASGPKPARSLALRVAASTSFQADFIMTQVDYTCMATDPWLAMTP